MTPADFYVLIRPEVADPIVTDGGWDQSRTQIDCPYCPKCGGVFGMLRTRPPLRVELENWNQGFADLVRMPGHAILFSQRVLTAVQAAGFTKLLDVIGQAEVVKVQNHIHSFKGSPPVYFSCEVGTAGPAIDLVGSGMMRTKTIQCSYCLEKGVISSMARLVVDTSTWAGEDIFRPRGLMGAVVVSRRFARLLQELGTTGCTLLPALQFSIDYSRAFPNAIPARPPQ